MRNFLSASPWLLPLLAFVPGTLPAQTQTAVAPITVGSGDGSSSNSFPWNSAVVRRYLQVHSDVQGFKMIKQLAWRRDGAATTSATATRTVDVELYMGDSVEWDKASLVISNNYVGPRTQVLPRQLVNFGPLLTPGNPAAFEMAIPLASSFLYVGTTSLAWEAVVYSNTLNTGSWPLSDVQAASMVTTPAPVTNGIGCVATGRSTAMSLTASHADSAGVYHFGAYVLNAPASQPILLALGASSPNMTFPGLCGTIYTDALVVLYGALSDSSGRLANTDEATNFAAPSLAFSAKNTFPGANLYLQALAIDPGSTMAIPLACSNGVILTVPTPDTTRPAFVSRIFNNSSGTAATQAVYFPTSSIGHGLVTEFTY